MSECTESNLERARRPVQKWVTPRGPVWKYEVLWLSSRKGLIILNATEIKRPRTIITSACCCHPRFPWLNLWSKGQKDVYNQSVKATPKLCSFLPRALCSFLPLFNWYSGCFSSNSSWVQPFRSRTWQWYFNRNHARGNSSYFSVFEILAFGCREWVFSDERSTDIFFLDMLFYIWFQALNMWIKAVQLIEFD